MRFGVLGPVTAWTATDAPVPIPGVKVRALLASLLVNNGRPVSSDRLVDDLWGDGHPANPSGALQVRVSQLRKALDDAEPGARELVVSRPPGYLISTDPDSVDAWRFENLAARAQETDDPRRRAALLGEALALWRGPALADFADEEFARTAIARLEEQHLAVLELHAEARLELGEHSLLAGELGDLVARHPLRERLRAAHLRALYRAGRQSEALDSYADLRTRLADELGLEPGPELVSLHQAILEQDPALDPVPTAPRARPRTNLPAPLTELIGRDAAVSTLTAMVHKGRLVTLTGSGGVGKTRLAIETARGVLEEHPDGVWLVELASIDRRETAAAALADLVLKVLDIRETATQDRPTDRLAAALHSRNLLLVLDNCEHLTDEVAALIEPLLRSAPGLRLLATSREPLGLAGEVLWEVPPLDVPGNDLGNLLDYGAIRLFLARVPGFTLDAGNAAAVTQLCQRLDGIPLALELAATRVRALGVHGLVARLDDRFRLLAAGHRGAPPRQRTLAAVLDWSWDLLTVPERVVLRRLAVHSGGCTMDAAEAVCSDDRLPAADVLDLLARLVDRSLVVMADHPEGPRYRLLESVAAYCVERLAEAGELEAVTARHGRYYTELALRAEPFLYGAGQREWLRRLDAEAANLRATIEGVVCAGDADRALRIAGALSWYWFLRGRLTQADRALTAALDIADDSNAGPRARAAAWHTGISLLLGDKTDWTARRDAALDLFTGVDDPAARARAEWFLAFVEIDLGDLVATEALLNRALTAFEELDDRWGTAAALVVRAKLAHVRADPIALTGDAERAAELFGTIGDRWGVLRATEWLAGSADMTGDYERAGRLHRESLQLAEELELWPEVSARLSWLGWIALELGDYPQAREFCEQAMRLAVEQDSHPGKVFAEFGLGVAARREGKLDIAETHLRNLREMARREEGDGHALYLNTVLNELGFAAELRGDAETALALHLEALDVSLDFGESRSIAVALVGMAGATALAGDPGPAARLLGAATEIRRATALPPSPGERDEVNRITATVRAALGGDGFAAELARGGETDVLTLRKALRPAGSSG
jgi:predicted ATPase/DNA-binding SARP family transcriptional activator